MNRFKLSFYLVARNANAEPIFKDHITTAVTARHWAKSAKLNEFGIERWRRHDEIIQHGIALVREDQWLIQVYSVFSKLPFIFIPVQYHHVRHNTSMRKSVDQTHHRQCISSSTNYACVGPVVVCLWFLVAWHHCQVDSCCGGMSRRVRSIQPWQVGLSQCVHVDRQRCYMLFIWRWHLAWD